MTILIDGYNLMHAAGLSKPRYGPGGLEKARRALLGRLAASLDEAELARTTVVFDAKEQPPGAPSSEQYQGLTIRFAAGHEDADDLVEELIRGDSAPRRLLVVSSDHRLQRAARRRRARFVDSERFLDQMDAGRHTRAAEARTEPTSKQHGADTEAETQYWLEEFKDLADDEALAELNPDGFDEDTSRSPRTGEDAR
jgi:predicted RNA-binding protein with PIN domain